MKAVIQRVRNASVDIDGKTVGKIGQGLLILLGVAAGDTESDIDLLARKIVNLRIFSDEAGKMNRSVKDTDGEILVVSQFTLLANCRHGNRPDFLASADPKIANEYYECFKALLGEEVRRVESGVFGADMQVEICNDGPMTVMLDTEEWKRCR